MCPYFTPGLRPLTPTCHRDIPGKRQLANDTTAAWKWFTSFSCFFSFFAERLGFRRKCGSGVEIHLSRKRISIFFRFLFFRFACVLQFSLQSRAGVYEYENSRVASGAVLVHVRMVAAAAAELPCVKGAI